MQVRFLASNRKMRSLFPWQHKISYLFISLYWKQTKKFIHCFAKKNQTGKNITLFAAWNNYSFHISLEKLLKTKLSRVGPDCPLLSHKFRTIWIGWWINTKYNMDWTLTSCAGIGFFAKTQKTGLRPICFWFSEVIFRVI
jgi:hypothetical protein